MKRNRKASPRSTWLSACLVINGVVHAAWEDGWTPWMIAEAKQKAQAGDADARRLLVALHARGKVSGLNPEEVREIRRWSKMVDEQEDAEEHAQSLSRQDGGMPPASVDCTPERNCTERRPGLLGCEMKRALWTPARRPGEGAAEGASGKKGENA